MEPGFAFTGRSYLLGERIGASVLADETSRQTLTRPTGRIVRLNSLSLRIRLSDYRGERASVIEPKRIGPLCSTLDRLRYWVGVLDHLQSILTELPPELGKAEETVRQKTGVQTGGLVGWDILPEGLIQGGGHSMDRAFEVLRTALDWQTYEPEMARLPLDRNPGAPTYQKGLVDSLLHRLITIGSSGSWTTAKQLYGETAATLGVDPAPHAIIFTRTGAANKKLPVYTLGPGSITREGYLTGYAPAHRHVFGVSRWVNEHLVGVATGVKNVLMTSGIFNHSIPQDEKRAGIRIRDWFAIRLGRAMTKAREFDIHSRILQDDISSFDRNVRPCHHDSLEELYSAIWGQEKAAAWRDAQTMSILGPGWGIATDDGFMYERPNGGTTTSGLITTSIDGCLLNFARVLTAMAAALGKPVADVERMRQRGEWSVFIWGDDTLLVVPSGFDELAYSQASLEAGFPCKLDSPPVFLMTFLDWKAGTGYALGTRILGNRVFPETAPTIPILQVLGMVSAMDSLSGNPLQQRIWQLVRIDTPLETRGIRSLQSLFSYSESSEMKAELADALKTDSKGPDPDTAQWLAGLTEHGFGAEVMAKALIDTFGRSVGERTIGWPVQPYEAAQARVLLKKLAADLRSNPSAARSDWEKYAVILGVARGRSTEEEENDVAA